MKEIPQEQRLERYDAVPQSLRDALNSEVIDETLQTISEAHHLGEERTFKMVKIYGLIVLGFIHPQDLEKELASELAIDKRLANEIAYELQIKILNPLMSEINTAFNYNLTGVPPTTPTSTTQPVQPEIMRPTFAPPQREVGSTKNEEGIGERPFILHEEQGPPAGGERMRPKEEGLVRPTFYEPEIGSMKYEERNINEPTVARLESGGLEEQKKKPRVGKTEEPKMRVVHYSGPQTPVDPFAPQQEIASPPPTE
ncbi:MAG: hypothetical protein HYW38_02005, partial [Candidatus Colwellbacteria bacterium]|nr:hypothetical protein [Candidatus Colwellbacteria bacterium]